MQNTKQDVTGFGSNVDMDSALDGQPSIGGIINHNDSSKYIYLIFREVIQCKSSECPAFPKIFFVR